MICTQIAEKISNHLLLRSPSTSSCTHFCDKGAQSYILMMESYNWQPNICGAGKTRKSCQGKLAFGKWCQPLRILQGIWSEFPDYAPATPEKDQLSAMKRRWLLEWWLRAKNCNSLGRCRPWSLVFAQAPAEHHQRERKNNKEREERGKKKEREY